MSRSITVIDLETVRLKTVDESIASNMKLAVTLVVVLVVIASSVTAQKCGKRNGYSSLMAALQPMSGANYIVGGSEAIPNEFPWQISFQIYYSPKSWQPRRWMHNCGGSIVNDRWIVTAAHCHVFTNLNDYRIVVGAHNLEKRERTTQTLRVEKVIIHHGYDDYTTENDIAMVKLAGRIDLNARTAAPVCLPTSADSNNFNGATCVTSGWGKTTDGGLESDTLLKVDLPIVPNPVCAMRYRHVEGAGIISTNICAGFLDHDGKGVCQGDSGGPLVCLDNGEYKLAGITSYGVVCGSAQYPAVYTRVSEYRTWIDGIMRRN